jgi:hypothetical protein
MEKQRWEQSEKRREEKKQGDIEEKESEERRCRCTKRKTSCKGTSFDLSLPKVTSVKKSDENL